MEKESRIGFGGTCVQVGDIVKMGTVKNGFHITRGYRLKVLEFVNTPSQGRVALLRIVSEPKKTPNRSGWRVGNQLTCNTCWLIGTPMH